MIAVSSWDDQVASRAATYLVGRRFRDAAVVSRVDGPIILGTRGTLFGNYTSYDMTRLIAKVRVALFSSGVLIASMDIDTRGQYITEWNRATWRLELAELGVILKGAQIAKERWRQFNRDALLAGIVSTLTANLGGNQLSAAWREEIESLERDAAGGT